MSMTVTRAMRKHFRIAGILSMNRCENSRSGSAFSTPPLRSTETTQVPANRNSINTPGRVYRQRGFFRIAVDACESRDVPLIAWGTQFDVLAVCSVAIPRALEYAVTNLSFETTCADPMSGKQRLAVPRHRRRAEGLGALLRFAGRIRIPEQSVPHHHRVG
jgi:hypothetical protein